MVWPCLPVPSAALKNSTKHHVSSNAKRDRNIRLPCAWELNDLTLLRAKHDQYAVHRSAGPDKARPRGMTAMLTAGGTLPRPEPPPWDSQESSISHDGDCAMDARVSTATPQIEAEF